MKKQSSINLASRWQGLILAAAVLLVAGCERASDPGTCSDASDWLVADLTVEAQVRTDFQIGQTDQYYLLALKAILQPPGGMAQAAPKGQLRWSLFPPAHALSCPPPTTEDEILWINITSNNDFDQDYLAGQELQDITLITTDYWNPDSYEPLAGPEARDSWPLTSAYHVQYYLLFDRLPTLDTEHTFNLQIMLASGAYFEITAPPISFPEATASP